MKDGTWSKVHNGFGNTIRVCLGRGKATDRPSVELISLSVCAAPERATLAGGRRGRRRDGVGEEDLEISCALSASKPQTIILPSQQ